MSAVIWPTYSTNSIPRPSLGVLSPGSMPFLRGSVDPYPRRLRQGSLWISAREAHWVPFWSLRRQELQLRGGAVHVQTRPADWREPHVKKGGGFIPAFWVVTCTTKVGDGHGTADLVVPAADAALVASYFSKSLTQPDLTGMTDEVA